MAAGSDAADPRTVALMRPSIRLLEHLGLWPGELRERTQPLRRLRLVDDTGAAISAPTITFDPDEIGEEAFGWNFPLSMLIPQLKARAVQLGVDMITEDAVRADPSSSQVAIVTTGGRVLTSQVVLAADGRNSVLRDAAGIKTNGWSYDQVAVATSFSHSGPHDGISTEYHKGAGPFTTVPLPGHASSLVWMERPAARCRNHGHAGWPAGAGDPAADPWRTRAHRRHRSTPGLPDARPCGTGLRQTPHPPDRRVSPCGSAHWRAGPQHVPPGRRTGGGTHRSRRRSRSRLHPGAV